MQLLPYQQRVVTEKTELDDRIAKLISFSATPTYYELDVNERLRLQRQVEHMAAYSDILAERIDAFVKEM